VRTEAGEIKGYHNSCLHRGRILKQNGGNADEFRCPYHGFAWNLDGSFKDAPCLWDFEHVERENFRLPEEGVVDGFMETSFGVFRGESVHVKIRFAPEVAGYIGEKIWHATQKLTQLEDGAVLFEADVAGTEEIKHWVMQWGAHAEVLSPASLRRAMQSETAAMLEHYTNKDRTSVDE